MFAAFGSEAGITEEAAHGLGAPLGGGIAYQGETCGAVAAGLMLLGLVYGPASEGGKPAGKLARMWFDKRVARLMKGLNARLGIEHFPCCNEMRGFPPDGRFRKNTPETRALCDRIVAEVAAELEQALR